MRKSSPVIRPKGNKPPDFAATKVAIGDVARKLRGRNHAVFFEQLRFGLWLLYAKARAREWQRDMKALSRQAKRALAKM